MLSTTVPPPYGAYRQSCIIDPALALSQYGVTLIKQFGKATELWVVRELWNILDNPTLYLQQPEIIIPRGALPTKTPEQERMALEETLASLQEWERFRAETDLTKLNLFWLGDSLQESLLPSGKSLEIFSRWEAIAHCLDQQLTQNQTRDYLLPLAFRDTIALALSLESAIILTHLSPAEMESNASPEICKYLEELNITCKFLSIQDNLVAEERSHLRQLLVHTHTAKVVWAGVHFVAIHLVSLTLPETQVLLERSVISPTNVISPTTNAESNPSLQASTQNKVKGFWYLV
jgi:hypothetical protein